MKQMYRGHESRLLSMLAAALLAVAAGAGPAWSEETAAGWSGDAGLGFVVTSGNTDTETISAKATLVYGAAPWKHTGRLDLLKGSDAGETNADRVTAMVKTDLSVNESSYLFGIVNYEDDRFSGYDYRVSESVGYGRHLLQTVKLSLDAEAGAGFRQSRPSATGAEESDTIMRLAGLLDWQISETSNFSEELDVEDGGGLAVTRSLSTLSARIAGNLLAKFSVRITHTSRVPPGIDKTDTETSTNLVYEF